MLAAVWRPRRDKQRLYAGIRVYWQYHGLAQHRSWTNERMEQVRVRSRAAASTSEHLVHHHYGTDTPYTSWHYNPLSVCKANDERGVDEL